MGKINGTVGEVFICYKDKEPAFHIVTNGDETRSGGKDDGIFEYRKLTYKDMLDGDILDQMAQKNTLAGWEKYVEKTPDASNAPSPSTPEPSPSTPAPSPSTPAPSPSTPSPSPPTHAQLTNDERKALADVMQENAIEGLDTGDLKAIADGKFRDIGLYPDAVTAAQKLTANNNALAREIDQNGDKDGWISAKEINPYRTPSAWTENHGRDIANLMQKAGVDRLSTRDILDISHNNWSKYKGPLSRNEIDAAKILAENGNSRVGEIDGKGNQDGFLQVNELIPGSTTTPSPPGTPNTPPRSIDPKKVSADDISAIYPQTGRGSNSTNPFTHLVNDIKQKTGLDGTGQLYLRQSDIRLAADMEKDPNKKAIFEWLHEHFNSIDYAKYGGWDHQGKQNFEDGLIGAGDLEKYFGK